MVACIMLTRDRPEMAAWAVRSFREQTYDPTRRILIILDTGAEGSFYVTGSDCENEAHDWRPSVRNKSIGELRNLAVSWSQPGSVIVHWDDDDVSHPNRIAEQVALLKASKKECVGYSDLLFWRECATCQGGRGNILPHCPKCALPYDPNRKTPVGEAWLWKRVGNSLPGTSLCYWREVWERKPFPDLPKNNASMGEDTAWLRGVDALGVSSLGAYALADELRTPAGGWTRESLAAMGVPWPPPKGWMETLSEPRLIASIHGGNTMHYGDDLLSGSTSWMRVPAMDAVCRERIGK